MAGNRRTIRPASAVCGVPAMVSADRPKWLVRDISHLPASSVKRLRRRCSDNADSVEAVQGERLIADNTAGAIAGRRRSSMQPKQGRRSWQKNLRRSNRRHADHLLIFNTSDGMRNEYSFS
jgi:hypothetical protein